MWHFRSSNPPAKGSMFRCLLYASRRLSEDAEGYLASVMPREVTPPPRFARNKVGCTATSDANTRGRCQVETISQGSASNKPEKRYSPSPYIGCDMKTVSGKPDPTYVLRFGKIWSQKRTGQKRIATLALSVIDRGKRVLEETQPIFRSIRARALV
jgi:hypothetical protein